MSHDYSPHPVRVFTLTSEEESLRSVEIIHNLTQNFVFIDKMSITLVILISTLIAGSSGSRNNLPDFYPRFSISSRKVWRRTLSNVHFI